MSDVLTDEVRALLDGPNFATVATLAASGAPQTSLVWITRDGDDVLFSTTADKQKARNLTRDPRVSLTVYDVANPYRSIDIRGTAALVDDPDKALPLALSRKYLGQDPVPEPATVQRLIVRITPRKVTGFSAKVTPTPATT